MQRIAIKSQGGGNKMKKIFLAALIIFIVFTSLYGQDTGKFSIGLRAGLLFPFHEEHNDYTAWIKANKMSSENLPNVNLAIYGVYGFTNYIGLQTEVNFMVAQGLKAVLNNASIKMTYSSLDIPVLLRINFLPGIRRFGIIGGPYLTFPLGKVSTAYKGIRNPDEKNRLDAPLFGFTAGLFGGFGFNNTRISITVRYNNDFGTSVEKRNPDFGFMNRRGILIGFGVEIPIK